MNGRKITFNLNYGWLRWGYGWPCPPFYNGEKK